MFLLFIRVQRAEIPHLGDMLYQNRHWSYVLYWKPQNSSNWQKSNIDGESPSPLLRLSWWCDQLIKHIHRLLFPSEKYRRSCFPLSSRGDLWMWLRDNGMVPQVIVFHLVIQTYPTTCRFQRSSCILNIVLLRYNKRKYANLIKFWSTKHIEILPVSHMSKTFLAGQLLHLTNTSLWHYCTLKRVQQKIWTHPYQLYGVAICICLVPSPKSPIIQTVCHLKAQILSLILFISLR